MSTHKVCSMVYLDIEAFRGVSLYSREPEVSPVRGTMRTEHWTRCGRCGGGCQNRVYVCHFLQAWKRNYLRGDKTRSRFLFSILIPWSERKKSFFCLQAMQHSNRLDFFVLFSASPQKDISACLAPAFQSLQCLYSGNTSPGLTQIPLPVM